MLKRVRDTLLRRSVETALQATTDAAASATSKSFRQVFEIQLPGTVFIRASHADVKIQYRAGTQVELIASLRASFGWDFVAEQDEAGVYIVAKRKRVVGALSSASFRLIMPPEANLILHLTPGAARLLNINGKLSIPGSVSEADPSTGNKRSARLKAPRV